MHIAFESIVMSCNKHKLRVFIAYVSALRSHYEIEKAVIYLRCGTADGKRVYFVCQHLILHNICCTYQQKVDRDWSRMQRDEQTAMIRMRCIEFGMQGWNGVDGEWGMGSDEFLSFFVSFSFFFFFFVIIVLDYVSWPFKGASTSRLQFASICL